MRSGMGKNWSTGVPALTVVAALILIFVAAVRPTAGGFTASVRNPTNTVGTQECFTLFTCTQLTTGLYGGIYLNEPGASAAKQSPNLVSPLSTFTPRPNRGEKIDGYVKSVAVDGPGDVDTAIQFDDVNTLAVADIFTANFDQNHRLLVSAPAFSQEVWFRTTTSGVVFAYSNLAGVTAQNSVLRLDVDPGGILRYYMRADDAAGAPTAMVSGSTPVDDGQWHHAVTTLALTGSGSVMELYVDGEFQGEQRPSFTPYQYLSIQGYFRYGYDNLASRFGYTPGLENRATLQFHGDMALMAGYAEVLPADRIALHYRLGTL